MHFRHLLAGLGALVLLAAGSGVQAQQSQGISQKVAVCNYSFPTQCQQAGPFTPDALSTVTLAVTSTSGRVQLTGTGGTVVVNNTGSVAFYAKLGGSTVTALTTDFYVPAGAQIPMARGTNTHIAAITASSTSTLVASSGNGTPSGGSGGGGSSGGGGVAGFTAAATCTAVVAGTNKPASEGLFGNLCFIPTTPGGTFVDLSLPSGIFGVDGAAIASAANPVPVQIQSATSRIVQATASAAVSSTSAAGPTQLIAASGSTKIYVTHYDLVFSGVGTFAWVTGTGTNCGTGTVYLTGASGHPMALPANGGIVSGGGLGPILITGTGGELCYITTGAIDISGSVAYAQF